MKRTALALVASLSLASWPAEAGTNYFANTATPLGGAATFTGATVDVGTRPPPYYQFGCSFNADQAGTAFVEDSTDGVTWFTASTAAIVAGTRLDLNVFIRAEFLRCREVNGATPQTVNRVVSSLTGS